MINWKLTKTVINHLFMCCSLSAIALETIWRRNQNELKVKNTSLVPIGLKLKRLQLGKQKQECGFGDLLEVVLLLVCTMINIVPNLESKFGLCACTYCSVCRPHTDQERNSLFEAMVMSHFSVLSGL